jgi:diguanylate cyclase (GGDEF)-like protein/PAS domain S-box-containing protein
MEIRMEMLQEQSLLIIGAGPGGSALLDIFSRERGVKVLGVVDSNEAAMGVGMARAMQIPVYSDVPSAFEQCGTTDCIVFNMTRNDDLSDMAARYVGTGKVIGGDEAKFFWRIILQLQTLKNELLENQTRMQAVLHNVQDGIISITPGGLIEDVNPAIATIFGLTSAELIDKPIGLLMPELERDIAMLETSTLHDVCGRYRELGGIHQNGKELPLETNLAEMDLHGSKHYVCVVRDISERKLAEKKLTHLALYDQLTGLPNRTLFRESLAYSLSQARRSKAVMALLFIDLDGFKKVNDTLGHDAGDQLLKEVAKILKSVIRESDMAARIGGDEFTVILNSVQDRKQAVHIAEQIINTVKLPMWISGNQVKVSASIGIALYDEHAHNIEDLIKAADAAMYLAKSGGKDGYRICS